jgi:hypothetical protein
MTQLVGSTKICPKVCDSNLSARLVQKEERTWLYWTYWIEDDNELQKANNSRWRNEISAGEKATKINNKGFVWSVSLLLLQNIWAKGGGEKCTLELKAVHFLVCLKHFLVHVCLHSHKIAHYIIKCTLVMF